MPSDWMDDHVGSEGSPRAGFEGELARDLQREWRGGANPRWRIALWGVAAAALLVGVIVVVTRDGSRTVTPVDTSTIDSEVSATTTGEATTVADPETSTVDTPETLPDPDPGDLGFTAVADYLDALGRGDYAAAAELLGRGGLDWESRPDIRPLYRPEYGLVPGRSTTEALAAALQQWCTRSTCVAPTSLGEWGFGKVRAVFDLGGVERVAMFVGYLDEGLPAVQGLPLQQPPAYQWVPCPDDGVMRQAWADLDGDGWVEQLVVTGPAENGVNFLVVCGTDLVVEEFEFVDGEGLWVYAVNPTQEGGDLLLLGSVPPFPAGSVYRLEGNRIVATEGTFGFITPMVDEPGRSTGCAPVADGGGDALVNHTFRYVGGTDLSTATQLAGTTRNVFGDRIVETPFTFDLPDEADAAFDVIVGTCHGLPVMTG